MLEITYIENNDRKAVRALLKGESLCYNDLNDAGVHLYGVKSKQRIIGYFGYELYGSDALFRSMVILPKYKRKGYGSLIWQEARVLLLDEKVKTVFLLTNSAAPFFKNQGFKAVPRSSAPKDIASTTEFIEFCPSDSVCMKINLKEK